MMKLVEEVSGVGELMSEGAVLRQVRYRIRRFQGVSPGSGLPIPGLHRIEGSIDLDPSMDVDEWVQLPLILKLEDGRLLAITLMDSTGRILSEGHGPAKSLCC